MGVARRFNKPRVFTNLVNILVNMRRLPTTLIFEKMMVSFAHPGQPQRENRQFELRIRLNVSHNELENYRLPRDIIEEIVTGFAASEYGNLTPLLQTRR